MSSPVVLVTGATGFVGSWCCKELLAAGFTVRASSRSAEKAATLANAVCSNDEQRARFTLVSNDLMVPGSFDDSIAGCEFVVHTAAVVSFDVGDAQKMLDTQVNGTLNVLNSARKSGTVRRVVMTSSVAAITDSPTDKPEFSEEDWTNGASLTRNPYNHSKTESERAAWKFVQECPVGVHNFELACINPALILGPSLEGTVGGFQSSYEVVTRLVSGGFPAAPHLAFGVVDVRDVAFAHVAALQKPAAAGRRFILSESTCWVLEIAQMIEAEFPGVYSLPRRNLPNFFMYAASLFDKQISWSFLSTHLNAAPKFNNTASKEVLGVQYRPAKEAVLAAVGTVRDRSLGVPKRASADPAPDTSAVLPPSAAAAAAAAAVEPSAGGSAE